MVKVIMKKNENCVELLEDFTRKVKSKGKEYSITVPKGFLTDLASVPKIFWCSFPPFGRYQEAAIIHDYLYTYKGRTEEKNFNREECDAIFLHLMREDKVGIHRAKIMYFSVRCFGESSWGGRNRPKATVTSEE